MSLKTRLDGKSDINNSFEILDKEGDVVAEISAANKSSVQLEIVTPSGSKIRKKNGWESKPA